MPTVTGWIKTFEQVIHIQLHIAYARFRTALLDQLKQLTIYRLD